MNVMQFTISHSLNLGTIKHSSMRGIKSALFLWIPNSIQKKEKYTIKMGWSFFV